MLAYSFVPLECIFIDFSSEAVIVALVVFIPLPSIDQWLIWYFICFFFPLDLQISIWCLNVSQEEFSVLLVQIFSVCVLF